MAWALGFAGQDGFYRGAAFLIALAVKWAARRGNYGWLKEFARRLGNLTVALQNALEDDRADTDELKAVVLACSAIAEGDEAGDISVGIIVSKQVSDGKNTDR
jgi:hypothetical protein